MQLHAPSSLAGTGVALGQSPAVDRRRGRQMLNCSRKIRLLVLALCACSYPATGERTAWAMSFSVLHELQKPIPFAGDHFGAAVAGVGMKVLVGAPAADAEGVT